jgi:hypothetical protein
LDEASELPPVLGEGVWYDPEKLFDDPFLECRINVVSDMNEFLASPVAEVPEGPFFKYRFELLEALNLKNVEGISVRDPVPVDVSINMEQYPSADPRPFPGVIGPIVILHHHDVVYGIGPD